MTVTLAATFFIMVTTAFTLAIAFAVMAMPFTLVVMVAVPATAVVLVAALLQILYFFTGSLAIG